MPVSEEEYKQAIAQREAAEKIINQHGAEKAAAFQQRLKDNPTFTDEELIYSATQLCPCGHGLAYPEGCGISHYWDCSAILKGIADKGRKHTGQLPFAFYNVKGESEHNGTTRGVFKPKE